MALLKYNNLTLEIGYHSLSEPLIITYYLRLRWEHLPLLTPEICKHNMDGESFLFTLDSFEPEDPLVSFFEKLVTEKKDMQLHNWVEPDVKFRFYTWAGKLPYLKDRYGDTINVGNGMEPFKSGITKLQDENGDHVELVIRIPQYHFINGAPEKQNWINNQYIILALHTDFKALESFREILNQEFQHFQTKHPVVKQVEFSDPWE